MTETDLDTLKDAIESVRPDLANEEWGSTRAILQRPATGPEGWQKAALLGLLILSLRRRAGNNTVSVSAWLVDMHWVVSSNTCARIAFGNTELRAIAAGWRALEAA